MAAYRVIYQPTAEEDINATVDFYEERNDTSSVERFRQNLSAIEKKLSEHPQHYGYLENEPLLRFVKLGRLSFNIVFEIFGDTVFIFGVRHTSRDSIL